MNDGTSEARIAAARATNQDAARLGMLCSLAVRVEPALLRRLRLLVPGADVSAETDLWSGELVGGASVTGLALISGVADTFRAELRAPHNASLRDAARVAVAAAHAKAHWSIRLEEQLYALDATGGSAAESERLLYAALGELMAPDRQRGPEEQVGIARWLIGALARLPGRAGSEAAAAAGLGAGMHLGAPVPDAPTPVADAWLPWLVRQAGLLPSKVEVAFGGGHLTLGRGVMRESGFELIVPRTDPLILDLDWHDRGPCTRRVRFTEVEQVVVDVAADEVTLTGLDGRAVTLRAASAQPAAGLDFGAQRARVRPFVGDRVVADNVERQVLGGGVVLVSGRAGVGKTALACELADRWEREGGIVLQHFYGVEPAWDAPETVLASLDAQLLAATSDLPVVVAANSVQERLPLLLREISGRPPLVLLDAAAADIGADTLPVLSALSGAVPLLLTSRSGHWPATTPSDKVSPVEVAMSRPAVCKALLALWAQSVHVAFGPESWDELQAALVEQAEANPGRLVDILGWALDQPAGTATVERIPWLLTVRERQMWQRSDRFELFAVALPGFTIDDLRRLAPDAEQHALSAALDAAVSTGVVKANGPLIDARTELVPYPRLAAALERRSQRLIADGHRAHLAVLFPQGDERSVPRTLAAGRYAIAHGVHHARAVDAVDGRQRARQLVESAAYLHRRSIEGGIDAVLDDLRTVGSELLPTAEFVAALARRQPERYVELMAAVDPGAGLQSTGWTARPLVEERPVPGTAVSSRRKFPTVAVVWPDRPNPVLIGADGTTLALLGTTVFEVPGAVEHAVGGAALVAAADSTIARVINPVHGTVVGGLTAPAPITALHLLGPDDRLVVGTTTGLVLLAPSGLRSTTQTLTGHTGLVTYLAEIDAMLLTGGADGTARAWDPSTGQQVAVVHHRAPVTHLCPLPSGDVATADDTGRILVWVPGTGEVRRIMGYDGPVSALVAGPAGLFSAGLGGRVDRWGSGPDEDTVLVHEGSPVLVLAIAPDGGTVAWHADRTLVRRGPDGREVGRVRPYEIADPVLAVRPVDSGAATVVHGGGVDEVVAVGDRDAWLDGLAVSRSGAVAAGTGAGPVLLGGPGEQGMGAAAKPRGPAPAGFGFLEPDGLLLAGEDGVGVGRGIRSPDQIPPIGDPVAVAVTDGAIGAVATTGGHLSLVRLGAQDDPFFLELSSLGEGLVPTALAVVPAQPPDGAGVVVGDGQGKLRVLIPGLDRMTTAATEPITAVAAVGQWIVAGTASGRVLRWKPGAGRVEQMGSHDGVVTSAAGMTPLLAATVGADGAVRFWDLDDAVEWAVHPLVGPAWALVAESDRSVFVRCRPETVTRVTVRRGVESTVARATTAGDATVTVEVAESFDLLGVALSARVDDRDTRVPDLWIAPDFDPSIPFRTTPDGQLDPPVRVAPGDRLLIRSMLVATAVHLSIRTPNRRGEHVLALPITRTEPA